MQTLVYENYNKFILATDTIRKMKTDFRGMEEKMELLSKNIGSINVNCTKISGSLQVALDFCVIIIVVLTSTTFNSLILIILYRRKKGKKCVNSLQLKTFLIG